MRPTRAAFAFEPLELAPRLLGALLCSDVGGVRVAVRITEVEAYAGSQDPASHAYRGCTRRNEVMFGPPGRLYCYFTYGMHWCANVTCSSVGDAGAVLVRAGRVVRGLPAARARRPAARRDDELARGPARLATCLGLGREHNGLDLLAAGAPVRVTSLAPLGIGAAAQSGPRVGVSAGVQLPWRFWLPHDPTVSAYRAGGRRRGASARQTDVP